MDTGKISGFLNKIKHNPKERRLAIGATIALSLLLGWNLYSRTYETTDNAYIEGRIVPISSRIPGYVTKVQVNDNEMMKEGQLIIELDSRDYEFKVEKVKADLDYAVASYEIAQENYETSIVTAPSNYEAAKSDYASALAKYEKAKGDLDRFQGLTDLTRTKMDLEHAIADEKAAKANLKSAEAKMQVSSSVPQAIDSAKASVNQLKAEIQDSKAVLKQAEKDLADTKIYAPYSGRITNRLIEVGTYVQPGQSLLSVVGKELWVVANLKETQIHKIKPGQKVDIKVDAFPKHKFTGVVDSIQLGTGSRLSLFPPENATGNFVKVVQRVPVKIVFDQEIDPSISLAVGMSVIPVIRTGW